MTLLLRIGTRRSALAMTQTGHVRQALADAVGVAAADMEARLPLVPIVTTGDRIQDRRLLEVGGKALFTKEIEAALIDGRCDLAVHSLKDVPVEPPPGLALAAIPVREAPRDAFVSERFDTVAALPEGARVGTASLRRQAQLLALRPALRIELLRGNVDSRQSCWPPRASTGWAAATASAPCCRSRISSRHPVRGPWPCRPARTARRALSNGARP